ncbi:MAG TPA: 3'(2'),5'-bisphosphate nucleotidase CysQ [Syntrophobacteria bacterium]|nr:3'(2'),5'-bisphosphate nucleotidase CysQ [Syntrophobacteria bacterium]
MKPGFLQECLFAALRAAKAAGDAILTVYRGEFDVEYKEDHSPLTVADRRAHTVIREHLAGDERLEGIPLLSEEGRSIPYEVRSRWDHFWLVDPLDGTKEFVKRRDEFTVNIALIQAGKPVLGVLLVPAKDLLYYGFQGLGSYKVKRPDAVPDLGEGLAKGSTRDALVRALLDASDRLPLRRAGCEEKDPLTVIGSRSHGTEALGAFVQKAEQRFSEVALISAGSALKFALVAEGNADIYPRFGPTMEWDTAAGQCLVEQSGGTVVELGAEIPLVYNKRELLNPHFICRAAHCRDLPYPLE